MMLDVARHADQGTPVSLSRISSRTDVSRGYLEQIATALRTAGLLEGFSGRHGGYRLGRPPKRIRIDEIVTAAMGPICIVDCLAQPELCERAEDCESRLLHGLVNAQINDALHRHTLADLLDSRWMKRSRAALRGHIPLAATHRPRKGEVACR